ncbi:MAG TPA: efflux RND transporter periplasmic adaptor subunit [Anaeromyxobacter sp.]|nr:efflux RND transporter periplasmic adaptor subunit [Anaeromyxobacter sp.]
MTRKRFRAVAYWIVAVLVVAGAAAYWRYRAAGRDGSFKYETATVDRGRVVARVTATGTLSALVTVQVGSQVSGTIASLTADFNSRVKKGQVIALIDPRFFQAAVEQARANVVAAQGNLAKAQAQAVDAQRQLGRTRELADRKLVAQADLDTAQANSDAAAATVTAAEGALAQAQAALSQATLNLDYTRIVSPTDGVVISRNVDVGQTVAASLQAPTLFVIAEDLAKMQVDTSVAEADVGRLSAGMPASFTVDAYPGQVFQGTVRQVRNAAQTVQNVVTYDAVVDVQNADLKLKPGMTATVTFIYAQRDDVVRVPNAALRFRPPPGMPGPQAAPGAGARRGGAVADEGTPRAQGDRPSGAGGAADAAGGPADDLRRTVWVLRNGQPYPVRVRTGISDGSFTELVQGELAAGDQAITDATGRGGSGGAPRGGGPPRLF